MSCIIYKFLMKLAFFNKGNNNFKHENLSRSAVSGSVETESKNRNVLLLSSLKLGT